MSFTPVATREQGDSVYERNVDEIRKSEYPMLRDQIYLDHAATTLIPKSLMDRFAAEMTSTLLGNPHSGSASSQLSTSRIDDIRLRALRFFKASPDDFDIVFVANATAGIKLVLEAFQALDEGFCYGYHQDAHTSLVGAREVAVKSDCLDSQEVERWLNGSRSLVESCEKTSAQLFAYPSQSNMNGRRLPLSWTGRVRARFQDEACPTYTLLDAAAMVSTAPLDLSDAQSAPDFTVLSFYKIFGFPDLGALIIRKASGQVLRQRKYFGGGTVDTVVCMKEQWHASKDQTMHESLEDGTLPFHSILALGSALDVHRELFTSMEHVSRHTAYLAQKLYNGLESLKHYNGLNACVIYTPEPEKGAGAVKQGPVVAFNIRNSNSAWVSNGEIEKLAVVKNIHIRTGGVCNPGGIADSLELEPWEMIRNFSAGFRCGNDNGIMGGKPTGIIRVSLGAMSNIEDVESFISFVSEFYVEKIKPQTLASSPAPVDDSMVVESLTIYPIKSCGGYEIPKGVDWEIRREGLAWDREWCLLHAGTGRALTCKGVPRMVLIKPSIDLERGVLRVRFRDPEATETLEDILVPLSNNPNVFQPIQGVQTLSSRVCGEPITAHKYANESINTIFSSFLGVPCTLARFPAGGVGSTTRHAKAHMQSHQRPQKAISASLTSPPTPPDSDTEVRPILLSNESPILAISRASIDALNETIRATGGKEAAASVFRANIVFRPSTSSSPSYFSFSKGKQSPQPYAEDRWASLRIGRSEFTLLGACRRCHMICVDQTTGEKDAEPFVTLAKTRRFSGMVFFGVHMCLTEDPSGTGRKSTGSGAAGDEVVCKDGQQLTRAVQFPRIRVGDNVSVLSVLDSA